MAAAATGVVVTAWAAAVCFWARRRPLVGVTAAALAVFAAATAGPVVGVGVKAAIEYVIVFEGKRLPTRIALDWLYNEPSPLPLVWAWSVRGWPLALAVLWPAIRSLPAGFGDDTRLVTGSRWAFMRHDVWPTLRPALVMSAGLVTLFSLGEVSASRLVATPGGHSFAHDVFSRMHFGITPGLAAECLILAVVATAGVAVVLNVNRRSA